VRGLVFGPMMPKVAHWIDFFQSPDFVQGSWAEHLASYWAVRNHPNVLFLTYGEMKKDLPGTVRRIADFMGVTLTREEFDAVVGKSSFSAIKADKDKFEAGSVTPWTAEEAVMMRRGESGVLINAGWYNARASGADRRLLAVGATAARLRFF
jgi:hypothetical protein